MSHGLAFQILLRGCHSISDGPWDIVNWRSRFSYSDGATSQATTFMTLIEAHVHVRICLWIVMCRCPLYIWVGMLTETE